MWAWDARPFPALPDFSRVWADALNWRVGHWVTGRIEGCILDRRRWATRDQLRIAIVTWIERTYHRRRRQAALGRLTPIEYEIIMTTPASQAA